MDEPDSPTAAPVAPVPNAAPTRETPPTDGAQGRETWPGLADATARWKFLSPQLRLWRRAGLLRVADPLKNAAGIVADGLARGLVRDLARDLVGVLDLAADFAHGSNLDPDRIRALSDVADHARVLAPDLDRRFARVSARINALAVSPTPTRTLALDLALQLALDLSHAQELANVRGRLTDVDPLDRGFTRGLIHTAYLAHEIDRAGDTERVAYLEARVRRVRDPARSRSRDLDLAYAIECNQQAANFAVHLDVARDRAHEFAFDLYDALGLACGFVHSRTFKLGSDAALDRDIERDLTESHDHLSDAASNFVGADLSGVADLDPFNLVGVRWDSHTRWPAPEWAARMRRASAEDPPGSGIFILSPEEGRGSADLGSRVPVS